MNAADVERVIREATPEEELAYWRERAKSAERRVVAGNGVGNE